MKNSVEHCVLCGEQKTTIMEIDYKKLEEFGITNEDPKWDNDNWLAKKIEKKTVQGKLDI